MAFKKDERSCQQETLHPQLRIQCFYNHRLFSGKEITRPSPCSRKRPTNGYLARTECKLQSKIANTSSGAKAIAILYSIIETSKECGLHPCRYLEFLLSKMPSTLPENIDALLPQSISISEQCHSQIKQLLQFIWILLAQFFMTFPSPLYCMLFLWDRCSIHEERRPFHRLLRLTSDPQAHRAHCLPIMKTLPLMWQMRIPYEFCKLAPF